MNNHQTLSSTDHFSIPLLIISDVEAFGTTTEVVIRNDLADPFARAGLGAPFVAVPVGDVSFPPPSHNNTKRCLRSRGCGFPVGPDWRDPDELGQHVSFNRQCRWALRGVLFFLIQTPSVESSGPLFHSTSVFSNDSVTLLAHIRAGPPPPHLAAIFFLKRLSALDCYKLSCGMWKSTISICAPTIKYLIMVAQRIKRSSSGELTFHMY